MPTCSLECTPQAGVDGVSLYYDQYGECYTSYQDGAYVCAVRFELNTTDTSTSVAIHFYPRLNVDDLTEMTPTPCPPTSGSVRWDDLGSGHVKLSLPVPTTTENEWGWNYSNQDAPPKLNIKIRVKRV